MALLDRGPRNATVITTKPTALLVFASDFYQIASKIPSLAEAIEIEARRRQDRTRNGARSEEIPKRRLLTKATPPTSAGQMTGNNECHYAPRWRNHPSDIIGKNADLLRVACDSALCH